jgi:hypothetical protein
VSAPRGAPGRPGLPKAGTIGRLGMTSLILGSYLGMGLFAFPREAVQEAGRGWALAVALALGSTVGSALLLSRVAARHAGEPPSQVLQNLGGPFLRLPLTVALGLLDLVLATTACAALTDVLASSFLPHTPYAAMLALLLAVAAYAAGSGIELMSRSFGLVVAGSLLLLAVATALMAAHLHFMSPWLPRTAPPAAVVSGALASLYGGAGAGVLYRLGGHCRASDGRQLGRATVAAMAVWAVQKLSQCLLVLGTLGLGSAAIYAWPVVAMVRLASSQSFFFDRLGMFAVVVSTASVWTFAALRLWSAACWAEDLVRPASAEPPNGWLVLALAAVTFIGGLVWSTPFALERVVGQVVNPAYLVLGVALPAVLWVADRAQAARTRRPAPAA